MVPMLMLVGCSTTSTTTEVTDVTTLPEGVEQAFPNAGPNADRSAVRDTVVAALSERENMLSQSKDHTPLYSEPDRVATLAAVEAPALVKHDLVAIDYLTTQEDPFRSARFEVGTWQGVMVRGDRAKTYVVGHTSYDLWTGATRRTEAFQHKVLLSRDATATFGWIVIAMKAAYDDTIPSFDRR